MAGNLTLEINPESLKKHGYDIRDIERALNLVSVELGQALQDFLPLKNGHEAVGVLREEYLKLERAVFHGDKEHGEANDLNITGEAKQLAAMAVRLMVDVSLKSVIARGAITSL